MKRLALLLVLIGFSIAPGYAQNLRSEDIVIQNTVANDPIREQAERQVLAEAMPKAEPPPILGPTKATDLQDVAHIVEKKQAQKAVMKEYNRKMDLAYKSIPNKPSKLRHPYERFNVWADYHQDRMRIYRTRDLPSGQGIATVAGMIFSAVAAFK